METKGTGEHIAYPNIFFTVDNFDEVSIGSSKIYFGFPTQMLPSQSSSKGKFILEMSHYLLTRFCML